MDQRRLILILGFDLSENGLELGPRHQKRLGKGVLYARQHGYEVCVAGSFSPKHPGQIESMSHLSFQWVKAHYPATVVHELSDTPCFNTRGELQAFMAFAEAQGVTDLAVASAYWHISRVRAIFAQEFGRVMVEDVKFVGLSEAASAKLRVFEFLKRIHMHLPPSARRLIEQAVRKIGINPSW